MKQIRKRDYIQIRNLIIEENIRIELERFLNEKRNIHEGLLADGYNFLKKISKSTLRILWEATKFIFKNVKEFFKEFIIVLKEMINEYKKGNKSLYFLTISLTSLSFYLVEKYDNIQQQQQQPKEVKVQIDQVEKKIIEKIKESKEVMTISFEDKEKIEKLCKLDEFKIFALETEDNYLCLPFEDEKSFKILNVANYYDAYFDITNEESRDILKILQEFKEKGKTDFKERIGNNPPINISLNRHIDSNGKFFSFDKDVKGPKILISNFNDDFARGYSVLVHEFIHYKDEIASKSKFTNRDYGSFIRILTNYFKNHKEKDTLSFEELGKILNIHDKSAVRYIASILQKNKYIDYSNHDFSKIILNKETLSGNLYQSNPVELNTFFSHTINFDLDFIVNAIAKNLNLENMIIYSLSPAKKMLKEIKEVPFPDTIFKKVKMYLDKNTDYKALLDEFEELMMSNPNITDFKIIKNQNKNKDQLKNYLKIVNSNLIKSLNFNEKELLDFLNSIKGKKSLSVVFSFGSLFGNFDNWYIEPYNYMIKLGNKKFDKENYFNYFIENTVNEIVSDLDINENEKEKKANELFVQYKKLFNEKIKNYEENIEKNKSEHNKLKENILREYVRGLII
jgi:hypothetical protein